MNNNRIRHGFLLTFFAKDSGYAEKKVNGFWLIKQFNNLLKLWEVAIYTVSSYARRSAHKERYKNTYNTRGNSGSEDK